MNKVRTRIAPSPTGDPHVGTAYIALFNRCFAHQHGGEFVLRIEDTDQQRSTKKSEQDILRSLKWLGLSWDEGPGYEGDAGPYRQSERSEIYSAHIQQLLDNGTAFRCFCTPERLDDLRRQQTQDKAQLGYDGHCLKLSHEEREKKTRAAEPNVIRMKIPELGECKFTDMLRGIVSIAWSQIDMQILIKSDGMPTYHFANVVDDHLMEISHVIRGEEWINSTPKHILLYEYFGWEAPAFCHMPLLRNPDKSKLSKRKNPTSIRYYEAMGYLPEALLNYLGMMGWTMPSGEEKFSLSEMEVNFDISRISLGGPIFDVEKLDWLNGKYIREELSDEEFTQRFAAWAFSPKKVAQIVPLLKQRVERFSDVASLGGFFIDGSLEISAESFDHNTIDSAQCVKILQFTLWKLEELEELGRGAIEEELQGLAVKFKCKIKDFLFPVFVALSGKAVSTSVIESIVILGIDITRARIHQAILVLGGISKKQMKTLEKEFRDF